MKNSETVLISEQISLALRVVMLCPEIISAMKYSIDHGKPLDQRVDIAAENAIIMGKSAVVLIDEWMRWMESSGKSYIQSNSTIN